MSSKMKTNKPRQASKERAKHYAKARLLVFLLSMIAASCSPVINLPVAQWQTNPIEPLQFDLYREEMIFDERSGLSYRVSNDERNLYVMLSTYNPEMRMKMLRGGMELKIDTMGGQDAHSILRFPMEENRITLFDNIPGVRKPLNPETLNIQQLNELQAFFNEAMRIQTRKSLTGFLNHRNGRLPLKNPYGIRVNLALDNKGELHYFAIIPLNTIITGQGNVVTNETLTLTVLVKGIQIPGHPQPLFPGPMSRPDRDNLPTLDGTQRERLEREAMRPPVPFRTHQLEQPVNLRLRFTLSKAG